MSIEKAYHHDIIFEKSMSKFFRTSRTSTSFFFFILRIFLSRRAATAFTEQSVFSPLHSCNLSNIPSAGKISDAIVVGRSNISWQMMFFANENLHDIEANSILLLNSESDSEPGITCIKIFNQSALLQRSWSARIFSSNSSNSSCRASIEKKMGDCI